MDSLLQRVLDARSAAATRAVLPVRPRTTASPATALQ
jgi:hypothetical protein